MQSRLHISRIVGVLKLDTSTYEEIKADSRANLPAVLIVVSAGLATGIGFGIVHFFAVAGMWSIAGLLIILVFSVIWWITWSFLAFLIGTKILRTSWTSVTAGQLLRTVGFSASPGLLAILWLIPVIGGVITLATFIWSLITSVVAIRQTFGFNTGRAIATYLTSWFTCLLIMLLVIIMLSFLLIDGGCTCGGGLDSHLNSIVGSHRFNITKWEITNICPEIGQIWQSQSDSTGSAIDIVTEYFSGANERNQALIDSVEVTLEKQIKKALIQQDIYDFPPVSLKLAELPRLLVISPREKIESMREIMLLHDISLEEIERIEIEADKLGVSSLVVSLGGFSGVYPSMVTQSNSLKNTLDIAVEEWLHQYLVFRPLGFRYLLDILGIYRNYDIATMNETVAGIVSKEIGSIVYNKYYQDEEEVTDGQEDESTFDFNREMREIRMTVDAYLARGEVELAEQYMEQKRQYLTTQGYYIRKLNQAYFAWHGTYADEPTSVNPIGTELKELRSQSNTLKDFLQRVTGMTSRQDIRDALGY